MKLKMNDRLKSFCFLMCFAVTLLPFPINAQNNKTLKNNIEKIYDFKLAGFRNENKIYLRWLLANASQWRKANVNGYIIERAEKGTNNFIQLNAQPIKPITDKAILKLDKTGDAFKTMGIVLQKPDYTKPSTKLQEKTLYGMYFMLSSFETKNALISASAWVDSTAKPNKAYTYRISVANTSFDFQNSGQINIDEVDNKLIAPPEIDGDFVKKSARLKWNNKNVLENYFAIILEKSTDSIHFFRTTQKPFMINVTNKSDKKDENGFVTYYTDTAVKLDTKYYYRLKGLNIFGIESKPSKVFSGIVTLDLTEAPRIQFVDTLQGKYVISWSMPSGQNALVSKYQVYYSNSGKTDSYKMIKEIKGGGNKVASTEFTNEYSNYFKIRAIGFKKDETFESVPYFYQLKDTIPPAVPVGLTGTIDKKGLVRLHWHPNIEKDFRGYKVVKKYNNSSEYTLLNTSPQSDTSFIDSLPLNQLSLKAYYSITALDNLYNESEKAPFIMLTAPDTIAPAPPRLVSISHNKDKGVQLQWIKSFSQDVDKYIVYRKEMIDSNLSWSKYAEKNSIDTIFVDSAIQSKKGYLYKMIAIDKGGLRSQFTDSLQIKFTSSSQIIPKVISKLNVYIAKEYKYIELSWWTNHTDNVSEFRIYRSSNKSKNPANLIASLPANAKRYVDEDLRSGSIYTYYVKVVFKSGNSDPFEKIEAAY